MTKPPQSTTTSSRGFSQNDNNIIAESSTELQVLEIAKCQACCDREALLPKADRIFLTLIREKRLTDAIDWLEAAYGITGETAVSLLTHTQQGGGEL